MAKVDTKRRKKKPRRPAKSNAKTDAFTQELPPLVTLAQLAKLADVSDQVILNCANEDPNAPERLRGKYFRDPWLQYLQARKLYGPRFWKVMTPAERAGAVTGKVTPQPTPGVGEPPAAEDDEGGDLSGTATTPTELLRLSPSQMLKRKMAEEIITRRLGNQERKRRLIPRAEVEEHLFTRAQAALGFKRQMILELPLKLVGLERPEIESLLRQALDELFRRIATLGDPIAAPTAKESQPGPPAAEPVPNAKKGK